MSSIHVPNDRKPRERQYIYGTSIAAPHYQDYTEPGLAAIAIEAGGSAIPPLSDCQSLKRSGSCSVQPNAKPRVKESTSRRVDRLCQNSPESSADAVSLPKRHLPRNVHTKKYVKEMPKDEEERILASEEGKKLRNKERRQLRNKESARAFRSRRKGKSTIRHMLLHKRR